MPKKRATRKRAVRKNTARKRSGAPARWLKLPAGAKSVRVRKVGGQLVVEARRK